MENLSEKEEGQGQRIINPFIRGISSSCDDLLEEKLASDTNEPIGLITEAESQRPLKKENDNCSPGKGGGKKGRRRKISMPWFRQSSFGLGLNKLRLPKQHTIASNSDVPAEYDPENEGARARAASSTELLRRKVSRTSLHYETKGQFHSYIYSIYAVSCKIMRKMRPHICSEN